VVSIAKEYETQLLNSPYKMRMFASGLFPKPDFLTLYFPSKNNFLFHKMGLVLGSSITLLLLIVFCFGYTIITIMRQKKLSQMKTDFINNMTHEFKTPVSTILLASEALKDPSVVQNSERLNRLVNVIHDENNRIGSHVERVLQLAAMEKGNFKLNPVVTNVEDLIERVIHGISIQAENKNGKIRSSFKAIFTTCKVDELHFSNVIYNLLDNAIKYCTVSPDITVSTANEENKLVITVDDNGIGLSKEQQSKIFEQFYRVPTGNLHDVKGFGLGLHYVKTILEMHGGSIAVKSEKGKGSTFEIKIPLNS
jgi:two-component system phosphate regulon sensor histidine kinase PhoR